MNEQLAQLRNELTQVHAQLIEAEAELADHLAGINAFEFEFEARVGHLIDALESLDAEIERYQEQIQTLRNKQVLGYAHVPVDTQYKRAWESPPTSAPTPPATPPDAASEAEIKRLYRQLARHYHPDLATGESDRAYRTEKMTAINDAYAARSLVELVALSENLTQANEIPSTSSGQTEAQMVKVLNTELYRCRRRLREIEKEQRNLRFRPSVEVSIEVKLARQQNRDLLGEMTETLEKRIARRTAERDMLKSQFDQLGPEQGFIQVKR